MHHLSASHKRAAVTTDETTRIVYSTDNSIYQVEPAGVAFPTTPGQIASLVKANALSVEPKPIVARGGGSGTNGQSLTSGIMIDVKRHLNQLVSVDPAARTAKVQSGVVTAQLNAHLADYGLFWAPHTSTLNRATVAGMISTDAAGKGSLVHGRTHRHVLSLDVVLDDGTMWTAEPMPETDALERAKESDRVGQLWRSLLDLPLREGDTYELPELARGFSGYGIDRVRRGGLVDPIPLLCGSEGTLAVITAATLALTPLPTTTVLIVASYDSFSGALADAVALRTTEPTAIESFDETTLERGRSSPAWPALGHVVGNHRGSVLLIEYTDEQANDVARVSDALAATGRSRAHQILIDPGDQADAWKVRADAVGLLAKVATGEPPLSARPTAFVEDCAVPVANMEVFIAEFRALLDRFGLEYGMFGHADVGCVHVRPALDLTSPDHVELVRVVTDEVVALVAANGGILWGEHGRGFRGDSVTSFLNPETIQIMEQVKTAFDPNDLFNPGKLYRPTGSNTSIVAVDEPSLRGDVNRTVPVTVRNHFESAFACNGNGLCHDYSAAEVMCPSFKASGNPELSPKGRADLLRAWLAQTEGSSGQSSQATSSRSDPSLADAISDNLHQCLSCSACTGRCPVEVDIPELKSRFLERYYTTRRRPLSHAILSQFESLASLAANTPGPSWLGAGLGGKALGKALGLVDLPLPPRGPKRKLPSFVPGDGSDVVILPDVFTSVLEPTTLHKTFDVLTNLGFCVTVASLVASGKFDHVKGKRSSFARAVKAQQALVNSIAATGARPIVIEPAVALLHHHEYPTLINQYPSESVLHLVDLLAEVAPTLSRLERQKPVGSVSLLSHCTEQALAPENLRAWALVLESAGYTVETPQVGCCGMAGIFGHEIENQNMSKALWQLSWEPTLASGTSAVATGYSCRSQAKRFAEQSCGQARPKIDHPIHLL